MRNNGGWDGWVMVGSPFFSYRYLMVTIQIRQLQGIFFGNKHHFFALESSLFIV